MKFNNRDVPETTRLVKEVKHKKYLSTYMRNSRIDESDLWGEKSDW